MRRSTARFLARLLLADSTPAWKQVHRAADKYRARLKKSAKKAFAAGRTALNRDALVAALTERNEAQVAALAGKAIAVTSNTLLPALKDALESVLTASGNAAARALPEPQVDARAATQRALATGFKFDKTNPRAVEWIEDHAAETVTDISEVTRKRIREAVSDAFVDQFTVDDLADDIADLLGDSDRAESIARTETMLASNQGQLEAWEQAADAGLLTGDEKKEWIVTPDDRLCPICEPMDGVQVGRNEDFVTELGEVDAPPAHPRCRCTVGLAV